MVKISLLARELQAMSRASNNVECVKTKCAQIERYPVWEKPEYWLTLIDNKSYSDEVRRAFLLTLLKRHLRKGTPLSVLSHFRRNSNVFAGDCFYNANTYQIVPVKRELGGSVIMFQPPLLREIHRGIYIRTSESLSAEAIGLILDGELNDLGMKVEEIYIPPIL